MSPVDDPDLPSELQLRIEFEFTEAEIAYFTSAGLHCTDDILNLPDGEAEYHLEKLRHIRRNIEENYAKLNCSNTPGDPS